MKNLRYNITITSQKLLPAHTLIDSIPFDDLIFIPERISRAVALVILNTIGRRE